MKLKIGRRKDILSWYNAAIVFTVIIILLNIAVAGEVYWCLIQTVFHLIFNQMIFCLLLMGKRVIINGYTEYLKLFSSFLLINISFLFFNLTNLQFNALTICVIITCYGLALILSKNWILRTELTRSIALILSNITQYMLLAFNINTIFIYVISLIWFNFLGVLFFDICFEKLADILDSDSLGFYITGAVNFIYTIISWRVLKPLGHAIVYFIVAVCIPTIFFLFNFKIVGYAVIYIFLNLILVCLITYDKVLTTPLATLGIAMKLSPEERNDFFNKVEFLIENLYTPRLVGLSTGYIISNWIVAGYVRERRVLYKGWAKQFQAELSAGLLADSTAKLTLNCNRPAIDLLIKALDSISSGTESEESGADKFNEVNNMLWEDAKDDRYAKLLLLYLTAQLEILQQTLNVCQDKWLKGVAEFQDENKQRLKAPIIDYDILKNPALYSSFFNIIFNK